MRASWVRRSQRRITGGSLGYSCAVATLRNAADLSLLLYSSGLQDFLDVLDAQRSLLALQELLAASQAEVTTT